MHCLETLKRLNAGEIEINRSVDFAPSARSVDVEDSNPRKGEREEIEPPYGICEKCGEAFELPVDFDPETYHCNDCLFEEVAV